MAEGKTFGEKLNIWLQNIAIILAGVWAIYTFAYKEFVQPASAPAHIGIDVELKHSGTHAVSDDSFTVIVASVTLSNTSSRSVHKLAGVGLLYGYRLDSPVIQEESLPTCANEILSQHAESQVGLVSFAGKKRLLGVASIGAEESLMPGEHSNQDWIFHIPANQYDYVELISTAAQAVDDENVEIGWSLSTDGNTLLTEMSEVDDNGIRTIVSDTDFPVRAKQLRKNTQLGTVECRSVLHFGED